MRILQGLVSLFSLFVAGMLAPSIGADSSGSALAAQAVATPGVGSTLAAQRELRVRFHRLWRRTAMIHTGWERGLWLRGPLLAEDYAHRAALVRFLRTELVPYVTSKRGKVYPVAESIHSRIIEGLVERLDTAARALDARDFQNNAFALSVIVNNYFAREHRVIEQLLALRPKH